MKRAVTAVLVVRILYIIGAVLMGGLSLFALIGFSAAGVIGHPIILAILALLFGLTTLYILGAILIHAQPMLWSILIAALQTLSALSGMRDGFSLADVISVAIAAGCWIAVAMISSAKKTFDRYGGYPGRGPARSGRRRGGPAPRRARRR